MKARNIYLVVFSGVSVLGIMLIVYSYQVFKNPNLIVRQEQGELLIPEKATIQQVLDSLTAHQYVEDVVSFMFVSKLLGYHDNIKPGRYILSKNLTNIDAVRRLRSGAQTPVNVTFTNARLKEELPEKLCRNITANPDEFYALLTNPKKVKELGFDSLTIAAMFLPNTYEMYWTTNAEELMARMKREYDRFWNEARRKKAEALGLTPIQVSILASIVQAETIKSDEKSTVAGLYINRLNRGMLLEADPTVVFANKDFTITRVLNKHLKVDSPYNTYKYSGLPPGPINIPEISSIEAVLNYKKHNYIFMCAKEDFSGYHNFAATNREHVNNANRYRRALSRRGIKN
ncbi:endolytic transglycosylase MltG [Rapidithrix thailandica]|uniref:Endolytic murein transglycosylase n=1 Tax=Rapidithrix thailandica TaxID=413964 RepID=A0AAW9S2G6_9BACT